MAMNRIITFTLSEMGATVGLVAEGYDLVLTDHSDWYVAASRGKGREQ